MNIKMILNGSSVSLGLFIPLTLNLLFFFLHFYEVDILSLDSEFIP